LLNSALVSVQCPVPSGRPTSTTRPGISFDSSYVGHAQEGADGSELTDYDLIGSVVKGAGMFALNQIDHFDLLYMPPPGKHRDVGPTAMLAAELFCRKRGAMLIMDPPQVWDSFETAIEGLRSDEISSPNIIGYFPRVVATNSDDAAPRVVGGAIAGLLCKLDRLQGSWEDLDQPGFGFDRKLVPTCELSTAQAQALVRRGVNVIVDNSSGRATLCGSVTMGFSKQLERVFANLTVRRLCLSITSDVEHAIRWAVFERNETRVAERIHAQVHAYMSALTDSGAFSDDNFLVQCDAGLHSNPVDPHRGVTVLLAFRPAGSDETVALTLHQTVTGCRVAPTAFAPVIAQVA
jgi:hypothetical protein